MRFDVPEPVEADCDLHIALTDATGDKPGTVVCEVPCNLLGARFAQLFSVGRGRDFPCISGHEKTHDQSSANRDCDWQSVLGYRPRAQGSIKPKKASPKLPVWEIHPVMKLNVL
jgi:hypothetical protein